MYNHKQSINRIHLCHSNKDPIVRTENDFKNLTDECGKITNLSEHAAILVPFYYLPLLILILLIMKVMSAKVYSKLISRLVVVDSVESHGNELCGANIKQPIHI